MAKFVHPVSKVPKQRHLGYAASRWIVFSDGSTLARLVEPAVHGKRRVRVRMIATPVLEVCELVMETLAPTAMCGRASAGRRNGRPPALDDGRVDRSAVVAYPYAEIVPMTNRKALPGKPAETAMAASKGQAIPRKRVGRPCCAAASCRNRVKAFAAARENPSRNGKRPEILRSRVTAVDVWTPKPSIDIKCAIVMIKLGAAPPGQLRLQRNDRRQSQACAMAEKLQLCCRWREVHGIASSAVSFDPGGRP